MGKEDEQDLIFLDTDHVSINLQYIYALFMNKKVCSGNL